MENVSRRLVVGLVGGGVLAAPVVAHALSEGESGAASGPASSADRDPATLLQPLTPGSRLARWSVVGIGPLRDGAMAVALRPDDDADHVFHLEVMARDASPLAARPPAETKGFAVFVRNGGDGWLPTEEEQGLAAMTLGSVIERNEEGTSAAGFLTHAARLSRGHAAPALAPVR